MTYNMYIYIYKVKLHIYIYTHKVKLPMFHGHKQDIDHQKRGTCKLKRL